MKRQVIFSLFVSVLLTFMAHESHAIILVDFNPPAMNVLKGDSFVIDLFADIPQTEAIISWELDLLYDSTRISFDSAVVGNIWDVPISGDGDGLGGLKLPPNSVWGQDVLLAQLNFTYFGLGSTALNLAADPNEGFMKNPILGGGLVSWQLNLPATINQTPIPEPATIFLISSGLAVFGILRWRRKKIDNQG